MNCETARLLAETNDPGLDQHLLTCPACLVATHAPYHAAPPGLEEKILQGLRREPAARPPWRRLALAAGLLLAVSAGWNVALLRSRVDPGQLLASEVLSAHLRSLAGTHLLDVPSSDQHTVKPWFNGKLDFSPAVKNLEGFPLLGGRLEYLQGHPAAALVYGRRQHIINLFLWPTEATAAPVVQSHRGYNLQSWTAGGMAYWAASDLSQAELRQFVLLYRRD